MKIYRGEQAIALLTDASLLSAMRSLSSQVPWFTGFHDPAFAVAWYRSYKDEFEAVVLVAPPHGDRLDGIWLLAQSRIDGTIVSAGAWQAEYQSWLADPEKSAEFLEKAMACMDSEFPGRRITLRFTPEALGLEWLDTHALGRRCIREVMRRPVLRVDQEENIVQLFRNKTTRNQLNRLKQLGPIEFSRVSCPREAQQLLPIISQYYDLRQVSIHAVAPFQDDPRKACFHHALMHHPDLLHTTVLRINGELVSAHLGISSPREVHLGILGYAPQLGKLSLGKVHLCLLAKHLRETGFTRLDLTPDGAYKERFANDHDWVGTLTIFPSNRQRGIQTIRRSVRSLAKRAYHGVRSRVIVKSASNPRHHESNGRNGFSGRDERHKEQSARHAARSLHILWRRDDGFTRSTACKRDALGDLLLPLPHNAKVSRSMLIEESLRLCEDGKHIYTRTEEQVLRLVGWLRIDDSEANGAMDGKTQASPCRLSCGFLNLGTIGQDHLVVEMMEAMLCDVAQIQQVEECIAEVMGVSDGFTRLMEARGFEIESTAPLAMITTHHTLQ